MPETDPDEHTRRLAAASLATGDPTGWFEELYAEAAGGKAMVPWDLGNPHRLLVGWVQARKPVGGGRRALVVGCGLGRDAEYIAELGYDTVAFDVSATAVRTARRRFPDSAVHYLMADLLDPPAHWAHTFDLVVESMTVQALPDPPRRAAIGQVGRMVAPGGTLLVIAAGHDEAEDPEDGPPWPLTRAEVEAFATGDLRAVRIEDIRDDQDPRELRWRAEFHRPEPGRSAN
jgi:SAM-dependent methyltransferase